MLKHTYYLPDLVSYYSLHYQTMDVHMDTHIDTHMGIYTDVRTDVSMNVLFGRPFLDVYTGRRPWHSCRQTLQPSACPLDSCVR